MKIRSLGAGLVAVVLFAACGGQADSSGDGFGDDSGVDNPLLEGGRGGSSGGSSGSASSGGSSSGSHTGSSSSGSSSASDGGSPLSCGACTTDSECESACPAVQGGGTNCCDVGSGVCYATTLNQCPSIPDAGSE